MLKNLLLALVFALLFGGYARLEHGVDMLDWGIMAQGALLMLIGFCAVWRIVVTTNA